MRTALTTSHFCSSMGDYAQAESLLSRHWRSESRPSARITPAFADDVNNLGHMYLKWVILRERSHCSCGPWNNEIDPGRGSHDFYATGLQASLHCYQRAVTTHGGVTLKQAWRS